ncbi:BMP family lipoprotein [Salisediminibacterium halotolerans]|uniref:BMP family lipoprotein n=1 Tax=Salisediminibacterium halotolerans TaxID=517425 RepID=UPI000EAEEB89|nr:BMP family ABC transporter substrate-binding protein [Salisediminibacterium halotolerans]RLJ72333.1 nucleoside-binding protein [Actinophytocola xinjiangensis]RPE85547.1 nucleoside-binding protein [Salisediminibacterium halotolerans]TWG33502.1 nucleoside-binding protein [Salisediminibacterium halotolerans]GEL08949.1 BMP family ABC transporter substrate-binding protein [Salisediminibacterium halotolerans]
MKKRSTVLLSSVLAATTVLAACGENNETTDVNENAGNNNAENNAENNENNDGEEAAEGDFSAKMVTDTGGVDDRSFNESAWEGLTTFNEDYPETEVDYIQSDDSADYQPNLNQLAREGTDITFGIGFLMLDDIRTVAEQNPEQNFALVDDEVLDGDDEPVDNVANILFAEHEGSFLTGVVAAMHTETDHVGFIGGVESPLIEKFRNGFEAGVNYVDEDIEISSQYAQDFNDPNQGQQIADSFYGNDADIIYHAAGDTGNGLFTEAIDRREGGEEVWAIGVDQDQALTEGEYSDGNVILTSMVKRVDQAVYEVAEMTMNGEFPGGETLEFDLEDQGVGIAETQDNVSDEALEAVEEYEAEILNGEIEVPQTEDELEEFLADL